MSTSKSPSKSLPARPSLESLRKQAKELARDAAAGDATAIARARAHLPNTDLPLTRRNAQLVIAREYGFAGWRDLTAEVDKRLGTTLDWAIAQARRAIHDNDIASLTTLLHEFPALLTWRGNDADAGLVGMATGAYGDAFDPNREQTFTRAACAELLIDAGAVVTPAVYEGLLESRARGLLQLFQRKGLLPRTLDFFAATGDLDAVREALESTAHDLPAVNRAFMMACRFEHEAVAAALLDRSIELDPGLGAKVDASVGRPAFIRCLIDKRALGASRAMPDGPWQAFVMEQVMGAVQDGDLAAFVSGLRREPWLLGEDGIRFQVALIERATMRNRGDFIVALLDLDPALGRVQPPPPCQAVELAVTYVRPHLLPVLTRVWPIPDDLPYAAATGNLARVKEWFDASGTPVLGDLRSHYPFNSVHTPTATDLHWIPPRVQHVLDSALAWSVINRRFDVADFLLEHGADINTTWGSHEPASILHELVGQVAMGDNPEANYDGMQFLIDRGIDMTITDYRWNSTAIGWARYAAHDEAMARWLEEAERQQAKGTG